jgi:hypothetical protein
VWPPAINYCPDFLTLTTIGEEKVCIDMTGVAQSSASTLQRSNGANTGDNYIVRLYTATPSAAERVKKLCDDAKAKGITWEGVWDGSSCSGVAPPLPP